MKSFIKSNKTQIGFTYLDTLISLFLSTSIICAMIILIKIQFNDLYNAKLFFHKIYATTKISSILKKIITDIDAHNFNLLPIIHNNKVYYKDKSLCNISTRTDELSKDNNSNAISYFQINLNDLLKTSHYSKNTFYLCPFFQKKISITDIRTFLALSTDDFFEVSLNVTKDNNCYIAKIEKTQSILTTSAPINIKYIAFIPIQSTYTIYLAENKTLRYVTHKNNEIVENQPILQNIFKINFLENIKNNFYTISCKLTVNKKDKKEIFLSRDNLLERQKLFNLISYLNNYEKDY